MGKVNGSLISIKIRLLALLLIPVILYCIPLDYVLHKGPTLCLFKNLFGEECYGCGMTRAVFCMLHFDLSAAWHYNHFSVVVVPLLLYLLIKEIVRSVRRIYFYNQGS